MFWFKDDTEESMLKFMDEYVYDVVMKAKDAKDLMETRDQVRYTRQGLREGYTRPG